MKRLPFITALLLMVFQTAGGQQAKTLPELPEDPSISIGTLPNGLVYYFAPEKSSKDVFNVSLVQKKCASVPVEDLVADAGKSFSAVRFGSVTLDDFLARNGVLPTERGYIDCRSGSVSYTFEQFSGVRGEAVLDTLLLSLFNLAQEAAEQGQPSSSQAVIIAGDYNQATILSKMKTLCLVNPYVPGQLAAPVYQEQSHTQSEISVKGGALAMLSVHWKMAPTPPDYMATALPVISGKLSAELGRLVLDRLRKAYRTAGMDVWIDIDNEDSFKACGNESMTITVNCYGRDRNEAKRIFQNELDCLYTYGVDPVEYSYIRDANKYAWIARSRDLRHDASEAVERCRAAFLYGASLSTDSERLRFAYRNLPDSVQTGFFNSYMRGVIGQTAGTDSLCRRKSDLLGHRKIAEILAGYDAASPLKAPKDKQEYITGGVIWTFSNGVNVIYRKMDTRGMLYYSYASKGGRQYAGNGVFNTVDGIAEEEFSSFLASEGVEMEAVLNPADVRIQGRVPAENAATMFRTLSAISGNTSNIRVFGGDCYKLLVMVGDIDQDKIKKMMRGYAVSLGQGSRWKAVKYTEENPEETLQTRHYTLFDSVFPFDVTAYNYAVASVAYYALRDRLGTDFSDFAVSFLQEQNYVGFPLNSYRITYGVRNAPEEYFSSQRRRLGEDEAQSRIKAVISTLASEGISQNNLALYRKLALNEFNSWRSLPQYYIYTAMDRYLNNKDIMSRFEAQVNAVSAESLKNFYAGAAATDR